MNKGQIIDCLPPIEAQSTETAPGPHYRGYRVDPDQPGDHAVWFFGCSCVWGWGLPKNKTAPDLLEKMIDRPVINMGVNSGSAHWVQYCIQHLLSLGYRPGVVVIAWPGFNRWMHWHQDQPVFWAGWALEPNTERQQWRKQQFPDQYAAFRKRFLNAQLDTESQGIRVQTLALLKEQDIPYVEFGYGYAFEDLLPLGVHVMPENVDYASDGRHPGPAAQLKTALWVRDQLSSLGLLSSS